MSSSQCPNKQPERHVEYYISSGDLHLLVDNVLFRVHSFFFERDSERFKKILSMPVAPNQCRVGASDSKPFPIKNSSPTEFARFLWMFYNTSYSDYSEAKVADWTSILKIACEYEFLEVQHAAIRGLQTCTMSTVERIQIYNLYNVHLKYLVPLYVELAMRAEAPTNEEVKDLGSDTSLIVFRLREYLRSRSAGSSPLPSGVTQDDALQAVCQFLGVKIQCVRMPGAPARRRMSRPIQRVPTNESVDERRHAHDFSAFLETCIPVVPAAAQEKAITEGQGAGQLEVPKNDVIKESTEVTEHLPGSFVLLHQADSPAVLLSTYCGPRSVDSHLSDRRTLLICAVSWTLVSLWTINHIPAIHLL